LSIEKACLHKILYKTGFLFWVKSSTQEFAQGAPPLKKPRELLKKLDQNFSQNKLLLFF